MSRGALWHVTMSLDGFIAGPDHDMSAFFAGGGGERSAASKALVTDIVGSVGAILAGRRWLDHAVVHWDGRAGIYGGAWDGPVVVLTHHPETAPGGDDPDITTMSGTIEEAMAAAQRAAGGKRVGVFGASIAGQCLAAGLLDEIVVHVAPFLLGDGIRLYGGDGPAPTIRLDGAPADLRLTVA